MANTLIIQIPKDQEIDKIDLEKGIITLRDKEVEKETNSHERWIDNPYRLIKGYYVSSLSDIKPFTGGVCAGHLNVFATEKQAESLLAMAQLSQIIANDSRFGGPITKEEWKNDTLKYVLERQGDNIRGNSWATLYHFLAFRTPIQRELFLEENRELIKQYFML